MVLPRIVSLDDVDAPLELVELPAPEPGSGEILIRVAACGVCHTELDEIEGRAAPPRLPVVPGHEVVGRVAATGPDASKLAVGDRVGVGWIHASSGAPDENLSPAFRATGRDVDGGYAEFMTVGEDYACIVPDVFTDVQAAPLLCAGAIGYRALTLTGLRDGELLGLTGFGGSAHLVCSLRDISIHTAGSTSSRATPRRDGSPPNWERTGLAQRPTVRPRRCTPLSTPRPPGRRSSKRSPTSGPAAGS